MNEESTAANSEMSEHMQQLLVYQENGFHDSASHPAIDPTTNSSDDKIDMVENDLYVMNQ